MERFICISLMFIGLFALGYLVNDWFNECYHNQLRDTISRLNRELSLKEKENSELRRKLLFSRKEEN